MPRVANDNSCGMISKTSLIKLGRLFYGLGIAAMGIHLLILRDFRPDILPPIPVWPHKYIVFPIFIGLAMLLAGILISGLVRIKPSNLEQPRTPQGMHQIQLRWLDPKHISLYLGLFFLVMLVACQLPYILFFSPNKLSQLDVWFSAGQDLAYAGGAFVMAGSFPADYRIEQNRTERSLAKFVPFGPAFYSILMIIFGLSHFVFADFVSTMVPKWIGAAMFWTYFVGVALIGAGIALILRIWTRLVALLLSIMLFLFFLLFHIPDAIANPYTDGGNEIVRAIIALLFSGTALVISLTSTEKKIQKTHS